MGLSANLRKFSSRDKFSRENRLGWLLSGIFYQLISLGGGESLRPLINFLPKWDNPFLAPSLAQAANLNEARLAPGEKNFLAFFSFRGSKIPLLGKIPIENREKGSPPKLRLSQLEVSNCHFSRPSRDFFPI